MNKTSDHNVSMFRKKGRIMLIIKSIRKCSHEPQYIVVWNEKFFFDVMAVIVEKILTLKVIGTQTHHAQISYDTKQNMHLNLAIAPISQ